jgi:hypothetical protein
MNNSKSGKETDINLTKIFWDLGNKLLRVSKYESIIVHENEKGVQSIL